MRAARTLPCSGVPGSSCLSSPKRTWVSALVSAPRVLAGVVLSGVSVWTVWGGT